MLVKFIEEVIGATPEEADIRAFGDQQLYRFELHYHLKNPHFSSAITEIALPPDIPRFQQIFFTKISPQPLEIKVDADGNYLAQIKIGGGDL